LYGRFTAKKNNYHHKREHRKCIKKTPGYVVVLYRYGEASNVLLELVPVHVDVDVYSVGNTNNSTGTVAGRKWYINWSKRAYVMEVTATLF
jgi:hypothetical protein